MSWIKRWWPLVWKSTLDDAQTAIRILETLADDQQKEIIKHCADIERFHSDNSKLKNRLEEMDKKLTGFQLKAMRLIERAGMERIAIIDSNIRTIAYMTGLDCRRHDIEAKRFSYCVEFGLALQKHVAPECVAEDIAEQVKKSFTTAILKEYQDQSILNSERVSKILKNP